MISQPLGTWRPCLLQSTLIPAELDCKKNTWNTVSPSGCLDGGRWGSIFQIFSTSKPRPAQL